MNFFKTALAAIVLALPLAVTPAVAGSAKKDIVDTAVSAGQFTTLVAAVKAAGLVETLKGKGLFLSAVELTFTHPIHNTPITVTADDPEKFETTLKREEDRWLKFK